MSPLTWDEAKQIANNAVFEKFGHLSDIEVEMLKLAWENKNYSQAEYRIEGTCKNVGKRLWDKLTEALGEKVTKKRIRGALERGWQKLHQIEGKFEGEIYLDFPDIEVQSFNKIQQSGGLLRIKAPHKMGKTLLFNRLLDRAAKEGFEPVLLDFGEADSEVLSDYRKLLQWFCATLADSLEFEDTFSDKFVESLGLNKNANNYLERYLLAERSTPLVLALENVDLVFEQAYSKDFCKLLRSWNDAAKKSDIGGPIWKNLRLIIVHSTEVYASLDINSSPLKGVGLTITLPDFTLAQVQELAHRYQLRGITALDFEQLMRMFGGYPYLIQTAFAYLKNQRFSFQQLLEITPTEQSPFINDLRELLGELQKYPKLATAYREVVTQNQPVRLSSNDTFKLESMGLVRVKNNECIPRCDLYRVYFSENRL